jgi:hypothetical protein
MLIQKIPTDKHGCENVSFLNVEGLKATQSYEVLSLLKKLKKERFELAIEIGTQQGGFALILKDYLKCDVITLDIAEADPITLRRNLFKKYCVNYRIEDCFKDQVLHNILRIPRKKIIFCDGGHKGNEFNYFADFLNEGDFIGGHDYFPTEEDRDSDIWTTCELTYEHIRPAVEKHDLKPAYEQQANLAAWALYKKL